MVKRQNFNNNNNPEYIDVEYQETTENTQNADSDNVDHESGVKENNESEDTERIRKDVKGGSGKKTAKIIGGVAGVILLGAVASGSFYEIKEQEQAVLVTFGTAKPVTTAGLHFKIPFIQQVHKVNTTIKGIPIGYEMQSNVYVDDEATMITADYNFVNVDFFVEYQVSDPVKYLYASKQPEEVLRNMAQRCIRTVIGSYDVDSVLTTGKNEIQASIKDMLIRELDQNQIGIQLVNITIQDSEPPTAEVMQAFKAVENAKQGKETALNNANKYRNEKVPDAQAKADQILKEAEVYKQQKIDQATAQAARLESLYTEYQKNPEITKQRMFYEAMEEVLPDVKLIIDGSDGVQKVLPLESFIQESTPNE
ncbi:MAG: FtsH protease activity modulator HflK [Lachnospiraceae bacterium]|nr:FtsH protease activity modulator HflK [Robinsoniella sp.]MDY3766971.1 FtsH protease activity modulator HflK [Lachnospiraceae bacterium]